MSNLNIFNGFGIKPTNTHVSAGMDFYIPNVNIKNIEVYNRAIEAIVKSYKISTEIYNSIFNEFCSRLSETIYVFNVIHLFLALDSTKYKKDLTSDEKIKNSIGSFIVYHLTFDKNNIPGIKLYCNDSILINSGIKIALPHNTAGIFLNKSGMGNRGFDVRSQVIDEDYSGYVHLSLSYTKQHPDIIYCGDKITQLVIFPIFHLESNEINKNVYNDIMKNSKRGSDGFGSSDIKR